MTTSKKIEPDHSERLSNTTRRTTGVTRREALGLLGASLGTGMLFGCSPSDTAPNIEGGTPAGEFDYIVIGAGSAGCPLAARLLSLPNVSVLVIEAGGTNDLDSIRNFASAWDLFLPGSPVDWGFRSVPQPALGNSVESFSAGKVLGGSSSINMMLWVHGHRGDFDRWASLGCTGWDYESVLPSFRRLETAVGDPTYRGDSGPVHITSDMSTAMPLSQAIVEAAVAQGYAPNLDYNAGDSRGVGYSQFNVRDMIRQDAYTAFVKPHEDNPRLTVMTETLAKRVLIGDARRATGVVVQTGGQEETFVARREIIVAAGTVNSAKLLMLSGIGDSAELASAGIAGVVEVRGVGKNLQDHLISTVAKQLRQPEPPEHVTRLDVNLFHGDMPPELGGAPRYQMTSFYMRGQVGPLPPESLAFGSILLHPHSRGSVALNPDDPQGAPLIDPAFLTAAEDVEQHLNGYRMVRALINAPELRDWVQDQEVLPGSTVDTDEELLAVMRMVSNPMFHPAGTCKMGTDEDAVVDSRLRVRGVTGLRVAGAAVMPHVTSGNTNAPSMMIGERLGQLMTESS